MNSQPKDFIAELYIHRPSVLRPRDRLAFPALTVIAWVAYLYLWLPLATLVLWWGAGVLGRHELRRYPEFVDLDLFLVVAKALVVALVLLLGWAEYNRRRFQGTDRRAASPAVDSLQTAVAMGSGAPLGRELQQARRAVVVLGDNAVPTGLRMATPLLAGDVTGAPPAGRPTPT